MPRRPAPFFIASDATSALRRGLVLSFALLGLAMLTPLLLIAELLYKGENWLRED